MSDNSTGNTQDQAAKTEEKSPALLAWIRKHDRLDNMDIRETLEALGANPRQDGDRNKWKIQGLGNIIVAPRKQSWLNGNAAVSGYGSVSLVMHALDFSEKGPAVKWLAEKFPEIAQDDSLASPAQKTQSEPTEKAFVPPPRDDAGLPYVISYLTGTGRGQRKLPLSLIKREIDAGRIYASRNIDKSTGEELDWRCIFIGPSSAEIRSVDPSGFKGCAPGSDTEHSGYQIMFKDQSSKKAALVEAAITGLSLHTIDPSLFVVSTNGAGRFELQYQSTLEFWKNGFTTLLALDADEAGDKPCQKIFNSLFLRDYLSEKYQVLPEQIDSWLIQGKINSDVNNDMPETFFFGSAQKPRDFTPKIIISVTKPCGPIPKTQKNAREVVELSWNQVDELLAKYNLNRLRPDVANDWSEVLMSSDGSYQSKYEKQTAVNSVKEKSENQIVATGRFKLRRRPQAGN